MTGNVKRPRVSGSEEFAAVVRKVVRRHPSHRFFTPCHIAAFSQSILASIQNDDWRKRIKAISCEL